ncbi:hypothetical protein [Arthrobacter citreus]|uniref:hypothetical protein n=1 Tax=Arthrobacter citreus TaxID=1670 RepID=UPI0036DA3445
MAGFETITVEAELVEEDAARDIAKAVSARHSIARKYVMRIRRRHPEASPAQVIQMLERHYATSITTAGALITAGAIAADIGIAMIPGVGAAAAGVKSAGQQAAKKGGKEAAKLAAKQAAKMAAKGGATRAAALLPAGDEQLQFELTAIFALALAEIHGMNLDQDQAHTLVYGLSNERVSQQQIAAMATDLAEDTPSGVVGVGNRIAAGRADWSHWAATLSDALPGGAAQDLVRTMQTGQLDTVRETLSGKQQATVEYGVGALAGGVARFVFGREVVEASRSAFPEAPGEFPVHLAVLEQSSVDSAEGADDSNRALAALEDAARSTGDWLTGAAGSVGGAVSSGAAAVGTGAANVAGTVTRPFRSVDIDGDGIPDEPQALTKVKDVTGAIAGKAGSVGGSVAGLFKSKRKSLARQSDEGHADRDASEGE